jgi:hypothetical protein
MSDPRTRVRETARDLGLVIPDDRLDALSAAWEQAMAEAEAIRAQQTPRPAPAHFDAGWNDKR